MRQIADQFKGQIAAQAEADQRNAVVGLSLLDVLEDALQVVGCTAMIGAQAPVRFAATTAEIPCQYIPARML